MEMHFYGTWDICHVHLIHDDNVQNANKQQKYCFQTLVKTQLIVAITCSLKQFYLSPCHMNNRKWSNIFLVMNVCLLGYLSNPKAKLSQVNGARRTKVW